MRRTGGISLEPKDFFPVWGQLTPTQQEQLTADATKRMVQKTVVIHSGSLDCTGLLLVEHRQLRAYILSDEGREITLYRLLDRDICQFSASFIMRPIQFDVMIQAERDTVLWIIPSEVYQSVMERSAPLENFMSEVIASRFSDIIWLLEQIHWKRFDQRVAGFLLDESALEGTNKLKITHEAIDSHTGNPREVVTRMLRYFQSEGLVRLPRGTVVITDSQSYCSCGTGNMERTFSPEHVRMFFLFPCPYRSQWLAGSGGSRSSPRHRIGSRRRSCSSQIRFRTGGGKQCNCADRSGKYPHSHKIGERTARQN